VLTLKTHLARTTLGLCLSLLVTAPARATEALNAPAELHASDAVAAVPLVLGAPPAWAIMALGIAVVSVTVLRRRKAAPARARR
jgi:hypothetical protein